MEHVKEYAPYECPVRGGMSDGYNDLEFGDVTVIVRHDCPDCGTRLFEEYAYRGTYYRTEG